MPISSLSNEATTWDDYYALYSSLEARSQISKNQEIKIDLVPTELKFLNKMISIRPKNSLGYILKCAIQTQKTWEGFEKNPICQKSIRLVKKYTDLMEEAWQSVKANNPKYTLNRLDEAAQYVSNFGVENHMLRARITAGIGDPAEAVQIATDGLALSQELSSKGQPLMATKKMEGKDQEYFDKFILVGLYFARGQAYNKLGKHVLATNDLETALELEVADGMREKLEPDSRFQMEAKILTQLALAEMLH